MVPPNYQGTNYVLLPPQVYLEHDVLWAALLFFQHVCGETAAWLDAHTEAQTHYFMTIVALIWRGNKKKTPEVKNENKASVWESAVIIPSTYSLYGIIQRMILCEGINIKHEYLFSVSFFYLSPEQLSPFGYY